MPTFFRRLPALLSLIGFSLLSRISLAQDIVPLTQQPEWNRDYTPFRIAGNLYYVGSEELPCYLITTPAGNILINTGDPGGDTLITHNIKTLGFRPENIKIILTNQAHFDHVGGMAAIKKISGAQVMIDSADAQVLADGGNSDYFFGGMGLLFRPVKADKLLHDLDTIRLGGMEILMLHHPGHTKGACSFLFTVKDESRSYRVLLANIPTIFDKTTFPSMPAYPHVMRDYAYTLDTMPKLQFDIWLAAHCSQFDLQKKHKPGDAYNPLAFADREGYDEWLRSLQKTFIRRASQAQP